MKIRTITPEHIHSISEIENYSFTSPWPTRILAEYTRKSGFFCTVAISDEDKGGEVAGYCISTLVYDEIHVYKIATSKDHRRKGVASELLFDTFDFYGNIGAEGVVLEVNTANTPAIALYRKMGFRIIRKRKNYYGNDGGDAFVMGLDLAPYYQKFLSTT